MQDVFLLVKGLSAVDIAKRYGIDLQQKGKHYRGLCPFHNEKTPSFHVHKNRFKCFGCGWSGDAIALVSQLRNVPPLTAAKWIAHDFGIPIDDTVEARREALERAREYAREKAAVLFFEQQADEAAKRLELLVRTTETTLARGGMGAYLELAGLVQRLPAWEHLLRCLRGRDIDMQIAALKVVKNQRE